MSNQTPAERATVKFNHEFILPENIIRPDGWEVFLDNTAGTALYRRDESGNIVELKPFANPGFAFAFSGKIISVVPVETVLPDDPQAKRRQELDSLCIKWASRGYMPKSYDMSEFLQENQISWISKTQFKNALRDAYVRGVIVKDQKGRYTLKTST